MVFLRAKTETIMKKNLVYAAVLVLLCVAAYYLVKSENKNTIDAQDRSFTVKDTAAITKIFLADKTGSQMLLERTDQKYWVVNKKYKALHSQVNSLLKAVNRLSVRNPVPKLGIENAKKNLATQGIKVELYTKDGLLKTFYVGGATSDTRGTFMIMEGSELPFVVHILGWEGYLTTRFVPNEASWRSNNVFNIRDIAELGSIRLQKFGSQPQNINIQNQNGVFSAELNDKPLKINELQLQKYLQNYLNLNIEGYENQSTVRDSLIKQTPVYGLEIVPKKGSALKMTFFNKVRIAYTSDQVAQMGLIPDPDRYFFFIASQNDFGIAQKRNFDPIFEPLETAKASK